MYSVAALLISAQSRNQELQAEIEKLKKNSKKKTAKPAEVGEQEDLAARLLVLRRVCTSLCVATHTDTG